MFPIDPREQVLIAPPKEPYRWKIPIVPCVESQGDDKVANIKTSYIFVWGGSERRFAEPGNKKGYDMGFTVFIMSTYSTAVNALFGALLTQGRPSAIGELLFFSTCFSCLACQQ